MHAVGVAAFGTQHETKGITRLVGYVVRYMKGVSDCLIQVTGVVIQMTSESKVHQIARALNYIGVVLRNLSTERNCCWSDARVVAGYGEDAGVGPALTEAIELHDHIVRVNPAAAPAKLWLTTSCETFEILDAITEINRAYLLWLFVELKIPEVRTAETVTILTGVSGDSN
jgi:hypothetical protein